MPEKTTGAPALDPTVEIGGTVYTLRFSFMAQYEADRLGVNLRDFINGLKATRTGTLSSFVALLAAMVAHNFIAARQEAPAPEYWAMQLDLMPEAKRAGVFNTVAQVLGEWLKKQASEAVRLQEPAPAQGPPPMLVS